MSLLPCRSHAIQLAEFGNGCVVIAFIAVCTSQVIANGGLVWRQTLGFAKFCNGIVELALIVEERRQVAMWLPQLRIDLECMAVCRDCPVHIPLGLQGYAQLEIGVGVAAVPNQ